MTKDRANPPISPTTTFRFRAEPKLLFLFFMDEVDRVDGMDVWSNPKNLL